MSIFGNINPASGQTQVGLQDPMARILQAQAFENQPIHHPLQLAGRLAQLGVAQYRENKSGEDFNSAWQSLYAKHTDPKTGAVNMRALANDAAKDRRLGPFGRQLSMKLAESDTEMAGKKELERFKTEEDIRKETTLDPLKMARARASAPNVNVKVDTGLATGDIEAVNETMKAARASAAETQNLQAIKSALAKIPTGPGATTRMTLGQWGQSLGIRIPGGMNANEVADAEKVRNIVGDIVREKLKVMRPATDADREFLERTVPGLQNTPQGNQAIIDYMIGMHRRGIKDALDMREALEKRKSLGPYYKSRLQPDEGAPPADTAPPVTSLPPGYKDTGKRLNGKPVVIGPDGKYKVME